MRSGRLRHKIAIKEQSKERDEYGDPISVPVFVTDTMANVQVLSGSEQARQGVIITSETISVLTRRNAEIQHDRFIGWGGFDYRIIGIKPSDTNDRVVVTAQRELV